MKIITKFDLISIEDQLALIKAVTSHIEFDDSKQELNTDYIRLLQKLNNLSKNLLEKKQEIVTILNN